MHSRKSTDFQVKSRVCGCFYSLVYLKPFAAGSAGRFYSFCADKLRPQFQPKAVLSDLRRELGQFDDVEFQLVGVEEPADNIMRGCYSDTPRITEIKPTNGANLDSHHPLFLRGLSPLFGCTAADTAFSR